jgi:hypothetical protein
MRRLLALFVFVGGPAFYLARRRVPHREHVRLYYDDGSMITLERSAPEGERLLALARTVL